MGTIDGLPEGYDRICRERNGRDTESTSHTLPQERHAPGSPRLRKCSPRETGRRRDLPSPYFDKRCNSFAGNSDKTRKQIEFVPPDRRVLSSSAQPRSSRSLL